MLLRVFHLWLKANGTNCSWITLFWLRKMKIASPVYHVGLNWATQRMIGRQSGEEVENCLGSDQMSFLFKLIHNLLATQDCLSKMNQDTSSACRADWCSGDIPENLMHFFLPFSEWYCQYLSGGGQGIHPIHYNGGCSSPSVWGGSQHGVGNCLLFCCDMV